MSAPDRALRADARRSRDAIVAAASELFAQRGSEVQMDEIAERAGVGMGTLYRHFATKQALLAAIVGLRFAAMTEQARAAEEVDDPRASFRELLLGYLEAAARDAAFRYAILGPEKKEWAGIADQKARFADIARRIIRRAVDAGHVRSDLTFTDFVLITRGAMANMNPDDDDWRRHLTLVFEGIGAGER
ncbi:regulatory protein, tetR family [Amycolatopsis sacchari]|uniref:Regulatory protein, tetR family n=1 Tax=Amycolatopsis sacchari TaxID=115433 RepID=A0A1I4A573_9PSEU|nr:TetR/AcrR family transcriptional regulator [Amycolatopsis sacchari]SFK50996.1 regulatory protein, tetR family [Amycolatopsis sacchari]